MEIKDRELASVRLVRKCADCFLIAGLHINKIKTVMITKYECYHELSNCILYRLLALSLMYQWSISKFNTIEMHKIDNPIAFTCFKFPAIPFQKFKAMENKCEDQTKLIAELREEIEKLKGSQLDEKEVLIIIK